jgi:hypothetical protein
MEEFIARALNVQVVRLHGGIQCLSVGAWSGCIRERALGSIGAR